MADQSIILPLKPSKGFEPFEGFSGKFYLENGYVVFTESYHLKRGYCCKNACRHCPYGFKKKS